MSEVLSLDGFSLLSQGPTLTLSLLPGQSLCVVGPSASGKTRLLRALLGQEKVGQGAITVLGEIAVAGGEGLARRSTPQDVARRGRGTQKASEAAEALTALGLWEVRQKPLTDLSPGQLAACEVLPCLSGSADLMVIDGQLDRLDPWAFEGAMGAIRNKLKGGAALVAVTNRTELMNGFDTVLVMSGSQARFAGSPDDLLHHGPEAELEVETEVQAGVKALVEPFHVTVKQTEKGLLMKAHEGQEIAAKLLLEGYGDVKTVLVRKPDMGECLRHLTPERKRGRS